MPTINDATVVASAYDTSGNGGRKLIQLANKTQIAVVKNGTTSAIFYKSTDGFITKTLIATETLTNFFDVSIVPVGNRFAAIFSYNSAYVFFRLFDENGANVSFNQLDQSQTAIGNVSLAINDIGTELHAAWSSKNATYSAGFNIRYVKGTINGDGSVTWGAVQQLSTFNSVGDEYKNPSIVVRGDGNPQIFVEGDSTAARGNHIASLRYNGSSWSTVYPYDNGGSYDQANPSAIFVPQSINGLANGRIWVGWHGKDATDTTLDNIRVSYSDDGGVTWSAMQKLTTGNTNDQYTPSLTANKQNEVFVVFQGKIATSTRDIRIIKYSNNTWGSITDVGSTSTEINRAPSALFDNSFSLNFSSPLFIHMTSAKVGFYGTWTVTTISVTQGSIGTKTNADKNNILSYVVTTDGTMSTITEKVNGVVVGTKTATSGQSLIAGLTQAQWESIKYGKYKDATGVSNTLTVSMGSDIWTYTFDKRLATDADIVTAIKAVQDSQNTHLPAVKSKLASAVRSKGGTVNDTDAWDTMVSVVANDTRKKWASGTLTSPSGTVSFTIYDGTSNTSNYVSFDFSVLNFIPSAIILTVADKANAVVTYWSKDDYYSSGANRGNSYWSTASLYRVPYANGVVNIPVNIASRSYTWTAFE